MALGHFFILLLEPQLDICLHMFHSLYMLIVQFHILSLLVLYILLDMMLHMLHMIYIYLLFYMPLLLFTPFTLRRKIIVFVVSCFI